MFTPTSASDERIIRNVLRGRQEAFGELVTRYVSSVYAVALACVGNATDADDVAQEAFLRAYRRLDSLRSPGKFGAWLVTITRNAAYSMAKSQRRRMNSRSWLVSPAKGPNSSVGW